MMSLKSAKRTIAILIGTTIIVGLSGCSMFKNWFGKQEIEAPAVELKQVEIVRDAGWWFYDKDIKPTKGEPGNHAAQLTLAFIFEIKNSNRFPILLDSFKFTVELERNKLDDIELSDKMWIPAGMTNELRVYALLDVQSTRLNVLVGEGDVLRKKGQTLWGVVEKYWKGLKNSNYLIWASKGSAGFSHEEQTKSVEFEQRFIISPAAP